VSPRPQPSCEGSPRASAHGERSVKWLVLVIQGSFSGSQNRLWALRARCLPSMGSHWSTPTGSWDGLGIIAFCPGVTVKFLGMTAFDPLGRRRFYTCGSFSEKAPRERVGHLLRAEDGRAFLGGFLGDAERALRWSWRDGTLRPRAGAVNATHAYVRLMRGKRK
jgi:hypothetical protein